MAKVQIPLLREGLERTRILEVLLTVNPAEVEFIGEPFLREGREISPFRYRGENYSAIMEPGEFAKLLSKK